MPRRAPARARARWRTRLLDACARRGRGRGGAWTARGLAGGLELGARRCSSAGCRASDSSYAMPVARAQLAAAPCASRRPSRGSARCCSRVRHASALEEEAKRPTTTATGSMRRRKSSGASSRESQRSILEGRAGVGPRLGVARRRPGRRWRRRSRGRALRGDRRPRPRGRACARYQALAVPITPAPSTMTFMAVFSGARKRARGEAPSCPRFSPCPLLLPELARTIGKCPRLVNE